MGYFYMIILI